MFESKVRISCVYWPSIHHYVVCACVWDGWLFLEVRILFLFLYFLLWFFGCCGRFHVQADTLKWVYFDFVIISLSDTNERKNEKWYTNLWIDIPNAFVKWEYVWCLQIHFVSEYESRNSLKSNRFSRIWKKKTIRYHSFNFFRSAGMRTN